MDLTSNDELKLIPLWQKKEAQKEFYCWVQEF